MKICFLAQIWPEYRSSGGGVRTFSLVKACLQAGHEVSFLATTKANLYSEELTRMGCKVQQILPNDESFSATFMELAPDIALFDRFMTEEQYAWRIRETKPDTLHVLDTIDLHFLRRSREKGVFDDTIYREMASLYRSDLSLIISSFELEYLKKEFQFPEELLALTPFFYENKTMPIDFSERKNFVFMGNYRHAPNADAAHWLAKTIWPKIRAALPGAELHFYGAYAPKQISELHAPKAGIHFMGHAADQYETFAKYRVNLAPLRFGAGLKGKIIDGWSVGTPVVSTTIGAEGLNYQASWGGLVADTEEAFSVAALRLYENAAEWKATQKKGQELVESLFAKDREEKKFLESLVEAKKQQNSKREKNFLGAMLWHHSLQSTKYFSKWIEEKNKKNLSSSPFTEKS